jgi:hypothetical protein
VANLFHVCRFVGEVTRVDATLLRSLVNSEHFLLPPQKSLKMSNNSVVACPSIVSCRFVGEVTRVDATLLRSLVNSGYILLPLQQSPQLTQLCFGCSLLHLRRFVGEVTRVDATLLRHQQLHPATSAEESQNEPTLLWLPPAALCRPCLLQFCALMPCCCAASRYNLLPPQKSLKMSNKFVVAIVSCRFVGEVTRVDATLLLHPASSCFLRRRVSNPPKTLFRLPPGAFRSLYPAGLWAR